MRRTQARPAADGADGPAGRLPEAKDDGAASGAPQVSVSAQGPGDHTPQPRLVCRYNLNPDAARLSLSGRDHGLGHAQGSVLAVVEHDGYRVLHRGAGGCAQAAWQARDLQHGPGQPVHQSALHADPARRDGESLHGRPRSLDGQRHDRTAMAVIEVRMRLSERIRNRVGSPDRHRQVDRLLQHRAPAFRARRQNTGRGPSGP